MTLLLPEEEYPMEPVQWYSPKFDVSGHFGDFEQFKIDIHFANFGQFKTVPILSLLLTVGMSLLFYSVWVRRATKNNPNPLPLIKIPEPGIRSGPSYFQWFNQRESRIGFLSQ